MIKLTAAAALLALSALAAAPSGARAAEVNGTATAIDADVLDIGGKRVMLYAVESVERKQTCKLNGADWACWDDAMAALNRIVKGAPVHCVQVGDPDIYGRILGNCSIGVMNVNKELVAEGWAVAKTNESKDYVPDQAAAKASKLGLWKGTFDMPADFRSSHGIFVDRP